MKVKLQLDEVRLSAMGCDALTILLRELLDCTAKLRHEHNCYHDTNIRDRSRDYVAKCDMYQTARDTLLQVTEAARDALDEASHQLELAFPDNRPAKP